jgi:hypothetical protein
MRFRNTAANQRHLDLLYLWVELGEYDGLVAAEMHGPGHHLPLLLLLLRLPLALLAVRAAPRNKYSTVLKGLSHETDFNIFDKNVQNFA